MQQLGPRPAKRSPKKLRVRPAETQRCWGQAWGGSGTPGSGWGWGCPWAAARLTPAPIEPRTASLEELRELKGVVKLQRRHEKELRELERRGARRWEELLQRGAAQLAELAPPGAGGGGGCRGRKVVPGKGSRKKR